MSNNKTEEHKNKYVSYVPMSKNNTMTNMYRTILLVLLALLLLAACADDVTPTAEPADTLAGQPVRFTATGLAITPADAPRTRAEGDTETDFPAEGSTMTVYMTGDGNTWQADYTYNETNSTWNAEGTPLYWPASTGNYTFTAISPAGTSTHINLPVEWTEEDMTKWEKVRATYEAERVSPSTSPISLTLRHALVKVVVQSPSSFVYLTEAPYAGDINLQDGNTSGLATIFIKLLKGGNDNTHTGYILPPAASFQVLTEDNIYEVSNTIKDDSGNDKTISAGTSVTIELNTQP